MTRSFLRGANFLLVLFPGISILLLIGTIVFSFPGKQPAQEQLFSIRVERADAQSMQENVAEPVEKFLLRQSIVQHISGISEKDISRFTVQLNPGADPNLLMPMVESYKRQLPQEAVISFQAGEELLDCNQYVLQGGNDEAELQTLALDLHDTLELLPRVHHVTVEGGATNVCAIIADPFKMIATHTSPSAIEDVLAELSVSRLRHSMDLAALRNLPLHAGNGVAIKLDAISTIAIERKEAEVQFRSGGKKAILIRVFCKSADGLSVNEKIGRSVQEFRAGLPEGIALEPLLIRQPSTAPKKNAVPVITLIFVIAAFVTQLLRITGITFRGAAVVVIAFTTCASAGAGICAFSPHRNPDADRTFMLYYFPPPDLSKADGLLLAEKIDQLLSAHEDIELFTQRTNYSAAGFPSRYPSGECFIRLKENSKKTVAEVTAAIREEGEKLPAVQMQFRKLTENAAAETPLRVTLTGDNFPELLQAAYKIKSSIKNSAGVKSVIEHGHENGPTVLITPDLNRGTPPLSTRDLQAQVEMITADHETFCTVKENNETMPLVMRYAHQHKAIQDLSEARLFLRDGNTAFLKDAVLLQTTVNYFSLLSENGSKAIHLDVETGEENAEAVLKQLQISLSTGTPSVTIRVTSNKTAVRKVWLPVAVFAALISSLFMAIFLFIIARKQAGNNSRKGSD